MSAVDIYLKGCDATSLLLDVDVTDEQERVLRWLVDVMAPVSEGQCKPRLVVAPTPTPSAGDLCNKCWEPLGADLSPQRDPILSEPDYPCWVHSGCAEGAAW